jgi:N-formylglutamate amidohydrolase
MYGRLANIVGPDIGGLLTTSMCTPIWKTEFGDGPLVACAIHDGHATRPEVTKLFRLDAAARRYEEDPYTAAWTAIAPTRIIALRSRFEVDLNRPREKAVYLAAADAWGLDVWESPPPEAVVNRSLAAYDDFYAHLRLLLERLVARHRHVVVFDLHSYNHVRPASDSSPGDPRQNPEINLGTGSMNRAYWSRIADRWLAETQAFDFFGRRLDVRENVKFFGGALPGWVHQNFPTTVCALAIEVKKFFMDEWTGQLDQAIHQQIGEALAQAATGVAHELEKWPNGTPVA